MNKNDLIEMKKMRQPIDNRCKNCSRVREDGFCESFVIPSMRWPEGEVSFFNKCILADHIKEEKKKGSFVNPIKYSKRMGR